MVGAMHTYVNSNEYLKKALSLIPIASQTFSKSLYAVPLGSSPLFMERGEGSRVWDIDGNKYIDFVNALLAVSLGYQDPDVNAAVQAQMKNGVSFSMPHRLEYEVAELMVDTIPSAEQVRVGKNSTDATSAAIRLARAYTGRDHVAVCGYHGWQDWYISTTTRDLGVPKAVKALSHTFEYNNLASLERVFDEFPDQVAAVILEPVNFTAPSQGFLEGLKTLCENQGTVLIFDEMITGFRFHTSGAQALFNVTPHLSTFGKGMANGYPISAVVGQKEIMILMDDIFFSGTFGGETLSLAAAKASIIKIKGQPVCEHFNQLGLKLKTGIEDLISKHKLSDIFGISGFPVWSLLGIKDAGDCTNLEIKSLFLQECYQQGIFTIGTHNLSYAHTEEDISRLIEVYESVMSFVQDAVKAGSVGKYLRGEVLKPVFKVRS
jgi:glutamate-1-semialdehyde aminotransferase